VLPNSFTAILVAATLDIGSAVLNIAALSFLGLAADPRTPEWGAMIGNERNAVFTAPHLLIFPGLALTLTILAYNLLGDGLRDALDPRLER
jgi:ABC-type dipeptide/oligopeptide/nickel transport system permease subunit